MRCQHLVFPLVNLIWTSRLQNYKGINSCCFKRYFRLFFFFSYSSDRKWTQAILWKVLPILSPWKSSLLKSSFLVNFHLLLISHLYFSLLILPSSILQKRKPSFRKQKSFLKEVSLQVIGSPMESFFLCLQSWWSFSDMKSFPWIGASPFVMNSRQGVPFLLYILVHKIQVWPWL